MQKLGLEYIAADVVRFRLWATGRKKVMLRLAGKDREMQANGDGWFTLDVSGVTPVRSINLYSAMAVRWSPIRLPAPKKN
ncbi:hypothetical protein KCP76_22255 [Salmonella enterica subsp. enterica serovar Weltevreden]|nr:hypothetical protein KCP76_22255 [Salmonella enterica subsp. enterica serovar Weltevreden]